MQPLRQNNPLAPPVYNGLSSVGPNYEDKYFCKSFSVALTANQTLTNVPVNLDKDADFFWEAVLVNPPGQPFGVRFYDSSNYRLSDGFVGSFVFAANVGIGAPYVLLPAFFFPAGSSILMDLQEQSGSNNAGIQFLFLGKKRFYSQT
jgi:hypothetical protein